MPLKNLYIVSGRKPLFFQDSYYFIEAIKNEYNFSTGTGFPQTYFMYERQEKVFYGYTVYNGDYSNKKEVYMSTTMPVNHEIESWYPLQTH